MIHIRDARRPADYPILAAILTAEHGPQWPVSAEELQAADAARPPQFFQLVLLAEIEGEAVGFGSAGHIPFAHREGRFLLDLRVRPERQGQGVGKALYQALMERMAPLHPREWVAEVWEALPRPKRFVEERGFRPVWRSIDSSLDVRAVDLSPFTGLEYRLRRAGIEIITYDDLPGDPQRDRNLHELDWALLQDVPSDLPRTQTSLEEFIGDTIAAPGFLPQACFIARHGATWIGYSNLRQGEDFFITQMTGVLPPWRGQGVATLLKLKGIYYAQAHGGLELRTTNDEANAAMRAINERLGFHPTGSMIRYFATNPL